MSNCISVAKKTTVASLILAIGVGGCATTGTDPGTGETISSGGCNEALAIGLGALIGALAAGKGHRNVGAAVGGVAGGLICVGWNYRARQTKTAAEVQSAYRVANSGELPRDARIVNYGVNLVPTSTLRAGMPLTINSSIDVIKGTGDAANPVVEEELVLLAPSGQAITNAKKAANEGKGEGGYQTSFTLKMPEGVPQGVYPVRTALYLNGNRVDSKNMSIQIVMTETGESVAMLGR